MKTTRFTAFGIAVTIVGASVEAGDHEWCKRACDWIAEQPHVPHGSHEPLPTRPVVEFLASGSSSANVPFVPYDDSANNVAIRAHHQRRFGQSLIASMPSSSLFKLE